MPSVSGKQHRFMEMVAHDPEAAKRVGVPQSVGKDFVAADEGKTENNARARLKTPKAAPQMIGKALMNG